MFLERVSLFIVSIGALLNMLYVRSMVHKNDKPTKRLTYVLVFIMGYKAISLICLIVIREGVPGMR